MNNIDNHIDLKQRLVEVFMEFENRLNGEKQSSVFKERKEAINRFMLEGFPTLKHENWKYTNVSFVHKHNYEIITNPNPITINETEIRKLFIDGFKGITLVFINGFYAAEYSKFNDNATKIEVMSLSSAMKMMPNALDRYYGKFSRLNRNAFSDLNTALCSDGIYIFIPDGIDLKDPIHIINIADSRETPVLINPRNFIYAGKSSIVRLIETNHTFGENPALNNTVTEIFADENSAVRHYKVQNDNGNSYYIGSTDVMQMSNSNFRNVTITLNGAFTRNNLNTTLDGENCDANFFGLYFTDGKYFADNHTFVNHAKPNSYSNELYKGIINGSSTAVFNGRILVKPDAQKTNAYQSNKNILLSDTATINTKPELEIYADDVKCSHGATTGSLDEDSLFYLKARGIGGDMARALLLNAFAADIVNKINIPGLSESIAAQISQRLNIGSNYFCEIL